MTPQQPANPCLASMPTETCRKPPERKAGDRKRATGWVGKPDEGRAEWRAMSALSPGWAAVAPSSSLRLLWRIVLRRRRRRPQKRFENRDRYSVARPPAREGCTGSSAVRYHLIETTARLSASQPRHPPCLNSLTYPRPHAYAGQIPGGMARLAPVLGQLPPAHNRRAVLDFFHS